MTSPFQSLANDAAGLDDDGWALIAPFGRHPKTRNYVENGRTFQQEYVQVLDNASADLLAGRANSLFSQLPRASVGIPIFKGHGDLREHDPKALANDEKVKLGVVDQIRKSPRGIEAHFLLDNDGAAAVAAGWKLPSALWLVQPIGNEGQSIVARPFKLLSVALTRSPNIPGVESLANQDDAAPTVNREPSKKQKTMIEPLLGCDPSEVSPARAGAAFAEFAKQMCVTDPTISFVAAWAKALKLKPELAARMSEKPDAGDDAALPNAVTPVKFEYPASPAPASPYSRDASKAAPIAMKPFVAPAFQLPPNVSNDIFQAAWLANGCQSVRVDYQKVYLGVSTALMKQTGLPADRVRRQMADDYPQLCRFAGQIQ